jgi:PemK-like, MazF-like toxin of type II toxin-antitoxin system
LAGFSGGQIVIADWHDALPKGPNKLRPAVVVEDDTLFDPAYPNVILVPLTETSVWLSPISRSPSIQPRKTVAQSGATRCPIVLRRPRPSA